MLDLKSMSDADFGILVTPSVSQPAMYVRVEENGSVLLGSNVARTFSKIPVQIRLNKGCTALQIAKGEGESCVIFPKSGRKTMPNAAEILREYGVTFPAVFRGILCEEGGKWRGERQPNPTERPSQTTRDTKKK